jgi:carbon starvation protein CstA
VQRANGYRAQVGRLLGTRQRRLLLLDALALCVLVEAPFTGVGSEALAAAPLVIASLAALHLAAAVGSRLRRRRTDTLVASISSRNQSAPGSRYLVRAAEARLAEHDLGEHERLI